jgi:hypothetical protein
MAFIWGSASSLNGIPIPGPIGPVGPVGPVGPTGPAGTFNFADAEIPSGAVDGVNKVFTLAHTPNPPASLMLFDGIAQRAMGGDYTLEEKTITFLNAPVEGSMIQAWYRY